MNEPFEKTHSSNKPAIIGARWWQESLSISADPVARRDTLRAVTMVGLSLLGVGVAGSVICAVASEDDTKVSRQNALQVQRDYGWDFGAEAEPLTFDGQTLASFDRNALATLVQDLTPATATLRPYFVPSLLQSPLSTPRITIEGKSSPPRLLKDILVPIHTYVMQRAYRQGQSLASLFSGVAADRAVLVDMPGPSSVAFAAGAASLFEPVFLFDNWPHPLGIVLTHLTLAAIAYYQPLFVRVKNSRKVPSFPLFVLDRDRLNPVANESTQFDNRYVAKMPSASNLLTMGVKRLLYIVPDTSYSPESNDLNNDFVEYGKAGIEVRMCDASAFVPDPSNKTPPPSDAGPDDWPPYFYGGSSISHLGFWDYYAWNPPRAPVSPAPVVRDDSRNYRPVPRATEFSFSGTGVSKTVPPSFGIVPVLVAAATGAIVGIAVSRTGSFGRYSSSWGGG